MHALNKMSALSLRENGQLYKLAYDSFMGNTTSCTKIVNLISNLIMLTVFVIGCIGVGSAIGGSFMGWIIVGLGCVYLIVKLAGGNLKNRKVDLVSSAIIAACIITCGALGGSGILTNVHLGCALMGGIVLNALIQCGLTMYAKHWHDKNKWINQEQVEIPNR